MSISFRSIFCRVLRSALTLAIQQASVGARVAFFIKELVFIIVYFCFGDVSLFAMAIVNV